MNRIIQGDCIEVMHRAPAESVDLIVADPPFNIDYKYDKYKDSLPYDAYVNWAGQWTRQCRRLLKPTGSMFIFIGDEFAAEFVVGLRQHLIMRNWIIWNYGFGQNCTKKFARCHTHILYFTNSETQFCWNGGEIKIASDRQTKYNDRRAVEGGKIPPDVWDDIPRLCGTHKERLGWHSCQLPEAILERCVRVASNPGDVVLDPFSGSGTTCAVAKRLGRRYIGIELSANYAARSRARLEAVEPSVTDC